MTLHVPMNMGHSIVFVILDSMEMASPASVSHIYLYLHVTDFDSFSPYSSKTVYDLKRIFIENDKDRSVGINVYHFETNFQQYFLLI